MIVTTSFSSIQSGGFGGFNPARPECLMQSYNVIRFTVGYMFFQGDDPMNGWTFHRLYQTVEPVAKPTRLIGSRLL